MFVNGEPDKSHFLITSGSWPIILAEQQDSLIASLVISALGLYPGDSSFETRAVER
jgi:hypothetical protein